jgi:HEAT repeat protein
MSRRSLFFLAALVVALGYGAPAEAGRLYGNYRGPEDAKSADTSQEQSTETSSEPDQTGPSAGDSGDSSGGLGEGSSGGGESGGGESGGGESGGGESGGGDSGGSDLGGGGGSSEGASAGSTDDGSGGISAGGGAGAGRGKGSAASATEKFELVSWFFEHNREEFLYRVAAERNRRIQLPLGTATAILGRMPRDERVRTPVTPEDRERIFDMLKASTIDKESVVRDAAVIALGKLGTPQAVEVLLERLRLESNMAVKQDTLLALGLTRSPEAIQPLIDNLKQRNLTEYALLGLGLTGDAEKAAPAVHEFFKTGVKRHKASSESLACAAMALGALEYADATPDLLAMLKSKSAPQAAQVYACMALGRIGGEDAQKGLVKALGGKDLQVRRAAALALGDFPDASVLKLLSGKDGMKNNADPLMAGFAAISAGSILEELPEGDWKKVPDALREIAAAPNKSKIKAQYANVSLALFGGFDNDMRRYYTEELSGTSLDPDTMSSLAMSAGVAGLGAATPMLEDIAGSVSRDPKLGSYAALALGMVGGGGKERAKLLRDIYGRVDRDDVRRGAVLALGLVGDRGDVSFLINVIKKSEDKWLGRFTRGSAVVAIGLIGDGKSVQQLQVLLRNPNANTRAFGVSALGHLADKDPAPRLPALFGRNNFRVEFEAVKAVMGQL